ncbi:MAG: hypothetical protein JWO06_1581 [Bacteroidota bacterium]|nr:hypothetical protein [Bacteroidota bacterium]
MVRKKIFFLVLVATVVGTFAMQSCTKSVFACFSTDANVDSLHINRTVTFNANCSTNGDEFFWEFNNNPDSTNFGSVVTKTFRDTGTLNVYLLVVNGNRSSSSTQTLNVKP